MSANVHLTADAAVTTGTPCPGVKCGWLTVSTSESQNDEKVTLFLPENAKAAIAFLDRLTEKARELALMIDASHI